jgi:hypothetical protein
MSPPNELEILNLEDSNELPKNSLQTVILVELNDNKFCNNLVPAIGYKALWVIEIATEIFCFRMMSTLPFILEISISYCIFLVFFSCHNMDFLEKIQHQRM